MPDQNPRLYLATPIVKDARAFLPKLEAALDAGGVASLLLRHDAKDEAAAEAIAKTLIGSTQSRGVAFIVEGSPDFVLRVGADGLHVWGNGELLLSAIRRLSPRLIVGAGALFDRDAAMRAGEAGVDYVMFGEPEAEGGEVPFPALVERTRWWAEIFNTPCVAYARSLDEVSALTKAGADFVMLDDCVWSHARGPAEAIREALAKIGEAAV
jgi:thiamine-phosphate pyrophosphorylase